MTTTPAEEYGEEPELAGPDLADLSDAERAELDEEVAAIDAEKSEQTGH